MGAGGFIMAELTGVPYSKIMLVAIFPAVMYVFSVFIMVHYEAKKHNIKGEKSEHSAMEISKLDHLVLTVKDFEITTSFYVAVMGMKKEVFDNGRVALK